MNRLQGLVLIFCIIFTTGFALGKAPSKIVFSEHPITPETFEYNMDTFKIKQRIYYAIHMPKGFKDDFIRIQLIKKDELSEFWGYKIYYSKDVEVPIGKKFYHDYLNIGEKGVYVMQVMEFRNLNSPIARGLFGVTE